MTITMGHLTSTYGIFICTACLTVVSGYYPSVYYMHERCSRLITFTKDVRLQLATSNTDLPKSWTCTTGMNAAADPGDRLLVQYIFLDTVKSANCARNKLIIFNSDGKTPLNGNGDCGDTPVDTSFVTNGSTVSFKFTTDHTLQHGQFNILISSFHQASNKTCSDSSNFLCDNDRCISMQLKCNGYNDCGDNSDEHCFGTLSGGVIALIVIGCIIISALCVALTVVSKRSRLMYSRIADEDPRRILLATKNSPSSMHTQHQ